MAQGFEGTLKIIAQIVEGGGVPGTPGAGGTPSGPGSAPGIRNPRKKDKDEQESQDNIKQMTDYLKKMAVIGALLKYSKLTSMYTHTLMTLIGTLVDVVLAPLAPIMAKGFQALAVFVNWVQKLMADPGQALKDAWNGLVGYFKDKFADFWSNPFGAIGMVAGDILEAILITGLFGTLVGGPLFGFAKVAKLLWGVASFAGQAAWFGISQVSSLLFGVSKLAGQAAWFTADKVGALLFGAGKGGWKVATWLTGIVSGTLVSGIGTVLAAVAGAGAVAIGGLILATVGVLGLAAWLTFAQSKTPEEVRAELRAELDEKKHSEEYGDFFGYDPGKMKPVPSAGTLEDFTSGG